VPALKNLVGQKTNTTGTGDRHLTDGPPANARTFADAGYVAGDVISCTIVDTTTGDTEVGLYVKRASPSRLEVQTIRQAFGPNASGPTSPIDFQSGQKDVYVDAQAEDLIITDDVTTTPTASKIPRATACGKLDRGWRPADHVATMVSTRSGDLNYGIPSACHFPISGNVTTGLNDSAAEPLFFVAPDDIVINAAAVEVTATGTATLIEMGIYEATRAGLSGGDRAGFTIGNRLASWGTVSAATTGAKAITGLSTALERGKAYVLAVVANGTVTLRYRQYGALAARLDPLGTIGGANFDSVARTSYASAYPLPASLSGAPTESTTGNGTPFVRYPMAVRW
jgi:hypothetical protein